MALIDDILAQLGNSEVEQIGRQAGLAPADTSRAITGALPAILAGLANNSAASANGAASLASALDRNHDGSVLDDLAGFLGGSSAAADGGGILGHIFGARRGTVESGLGRASGIDGATMARVMALLAPIVMAYLGRAKSSRQLDSDGVASMLGRERSRLQERSPSGMDALGKILDADGDGSILDDLAQQGGGLLGSLFRSR
jgi:hypothetical protein